MATLVLGTVGSFLGPFGQVVGGIAGGFIDQLIFGAESEAVEGPRIDELRVPAFDQGSPAPWTQGGAVRVPGQIIWVSEMREEANSTGGGKGGVGGGGNQTTFDYFVDIAVACARIPGGSDTTPVRKVFANGDLLYEADVTLDITSTLVSAAPKTWRKWWSRFCTWHPDFEEIVYTHSGGASAAFFAGIQPGRDVTVTGFTNAANNGTFHVQWVSPTNDVIVVLKCNYVRPGVATGSCADTSGCAPGITEAAGNSIRFVETVDDFDPVAMTALTQYTGAATQDPDPLMEAHLGVGEVPAHRGTVYFVISNLKITKWGGSLPAFEVIVAEDTTRTVAEAIGNLLERSGLFTSDDYDTTGVVPTTLSGLVQLGPRAPLAGLRTLMMFYRLEAQARAVIEGGVFKYKLFFFSKENAATRQVDPFDRGAFPSGDEADPDLIRVTLLNGDELPSEVTITFQNVALELEPFTVSHRRQNAGIHNQFRLNVPLSLTREEARGVARVLMWQMWINERKRLNLPLPPTYIDVAENDILVTTDPSGEEIRGRVTNLDLGANFLIEVEALEERVEVYSDPDDPLPGD